MVANSGATVADSPLPICWATEQNALYGNAVGYTRANAALRWATFATGDAVPDPDADLAVHLTYALHFQPIPGRRNVLMTMYESPDMPPWFIAGLQRADALIVPCEWNREIFAPHVTCPIYVVPLGVHLEQFAYVRRSRPRHRPFRWLWVGAHNQRKGWTEVIDAWKHGAPWRGFGMRGDCELYLKTTVNPDIDPVDLVPGVNRSAHWPNVIVDNRQVTDPELMELYAKADGFVIPHMGEGFCLTLLEAFATGLPSVTILKTGVTEFADTTVCLDTKTIPIGVSIEEKEQPAHRQIAFMADVPHLAKQMEWVTAHWVKAQRMGKRAAHRATQFTWQASGHHMVRALRAIADTTHEDAAAPLRAVG